MPIILHQCQRKYKELRQSLVRRFPYAIYYKVEEEKKRVIIIGILHTRRDPATIRRPNNDDVFQLFSIL